MAFLPKSAPSLVIAGLAAWFLAAVAFASGSYLTWGKPTEVYLASPEGQWKYVIGPSILGWGAAALVLVGAAMFILALLGAIGRRRRAS